MLTIHINNLFTKQFNDIENYSLIQLLRLFLDIFYSIFNK